VNLQAGAFGGAWTDVRRKRCPGCGEVYLPRRGDNGLCSDRCYVRSRDRHRPPQNETLNRALRQILDRNQSRMASRPG
jgi:hypothetical protein